jgi:putative transposase
MKNSFTEGVARQRVGEEKSVEVQIPLGLLESLEDVREGFFPLCVSAGRQVLGAMMEQDREALCGPKGVPNRERRAQRAGTTRSEVTLGPDRSGSGVRRGQARCWGFARAALRTPRFPLLSCC